MDLPTVRFQAVRQPPPTGFPRARPATDRPKGSVPVAVMLVVATLLTVTFIGFIGTSGAAQRVAEPGYDHYSRYTPLPTLAGPSHPATTSATAPDITPPEGVTSDPTPVYRTEDNPLHSRGLKPAPISCDLPRFRSDPAGQDAFYRAALPCLRAAWAPVLKGANLPLPPIELRTITGTVSTPCGNRGQKDTALYCDGVIYMTARYYAELERMGNRPGRYLAVLAHEYGHHVQEASGILRAAYDRGYEVGHDTPAGLEVSRRAELQATCFGAMFLAAAAGRGAVNRTVVDEALEDFSNRGDWPGAQRPRDHGKPELNRLWAHRGFQASSTAACNTWISAPPDVA
ncbi:neutral zinc metallopeptidase [Longimycelium tulufanense]|nr:neutral zinc metallopeptidase [Longimycelium tulufanense]